ncbi:Hypp3751 [Branchiostoma lanceolatum]|uniref:Hypp3751 protein n=1 Tax=Branchiostoma lanceolatum TaxID=7740 RepID=A0A8K0EVD2_BRALA|nr:Hypp3751 [Branchiostoma lanceolatum]
MGDDKKKGDISERSPAVYSANQKEDMLLDRRLAMLNKMEKQVVTRITAEQRVVLNRFRIRLKRSELQYARLKGDKETEKKLRAKSGYQFNTTLTEEDDMLQKVTSRRISSAPPKMRSKSAPRLSFAETPSPDLPVKVSHGRMSVPNMRTQPSPPPALGRSRRLSVEDVKENLARQTKIRPATSFELRSRTSSMSTENADASRPPRPKTSLDYASSVASDVTSRGGDDTKKAFQKKRRHRSESSEEKDGEVHEDFDGSILETVRIENNSEKELSGALLKERRSSRLTHTEQARKGKAQSMLSMLAPEEESRPSLLALHLRIAESANFPVRVQNFVKTVVPFTEDRDDAEMVDYYTLRAQEAAKVGRSKNIFIPRDKRPGTPVKQHHWFPTKETKSRSLTLPGLDYEFEKDAELDIDIMKVAWAHERNKYDNRRGSCTE